MPILIDDLKMRDSNQNEVTLATPDSGSNYQEILSGIALDSGDVTLNAEQYKKSLIEVTTGHASNAIILPQITGKAFFVVNNDAINGAIVKKEGSSSPVTVAATKSRMVYYNGAEYVALDFT